MKKVLYAWIEQIVQFDSEQERQKFIDGIQDVQVLESSEADGGMWRVEAASLVADYLKVNLVTQVLDGKVKIIA